MTQNRAIERRNQVDSDFTRDDTNAKSLVHVSRCVSCMQRIRPRSVLKYIVWIVLLTMIPLTRRALTLFECVSSSRFGDVLRDDTSFQCHTSIHLLLKYSSLVYVLFVSLGAPIAMIMFLKWKKQVLLTEKVYSKWMQARSTLQYLNGEYKHDTISWYWHVFDIILRLFLCSFLVVCSTWTGATMLGAFISFLGALGSLHFQPYGSEVQNVSFFFLFFFLFFHHIDYNTTTTTTTTKQVLETVCHFCVFALMMLALAYKDYTGNYESVVLEYLCIVIGFLSVLVPLILGAVLLNLHILGCTELVRIPKFFRHLDSHEEKGKHENITTRVTQSSVESITDPMGDTIKQNQKLTGQIVKFGARLRLLTFSNRRRTEAKVNSKLEYKELKRNVTHKKNKLKALREIISTHETRNHHLVLCRQQAEVREEEGIAELRPETPVDAIPRRARRGVVGKMEHNAFLTTVDLHKIKTKEKRNIEILRDDEVDDSSSSSSSDIEM